MQTTEDTTGTQSFFINYSLNWKACWFCGGFFQSCAICCILIMVEGEGNGTIKNPKPNQNKGKPPPSMECPPPPHLKVGK